MPNVTESRQDVQIKSANFKALFSLFRITLIMGKMLALQEKNKGANISQRCLQLELKNVERMLISGNCCGTIGQGHYAVAKLPKSSRHFKYNDFRRHSNYSADMDQHSDKCNYLIAYLFRLTHLFPCYKHH